MIAEWFQALQLPDLNSFKTEIVETVDTFGLRVINILQEKVKRREELPTSTYPLLWKGIASDSRKPFLLLVLERSRFGYLDPKATIRSRTTIQQLIMMTIVLNRHDIQKSQVTLKLLDIGISHYKILIPCQSSVNIIARDAFPEQKYILWPELKDAVTREGIRLSFNTEFESSFDVERWYVVRSLRLDRLQPAVVKECCEIRKRKLYIGLFGILFVIGQIWQLCSNTTNVNTPGMENFAVASGILALLVFCVF